MTVVTYLVLDLTLEDPGIGTLMEEDQEKNVF